MKVKLDRGEVVDEIKKVTIETDDFVFVLHICVVEGKLVINKAGGKESGRIAIYSRYSNEIEII